MPLLSIENIGARLHAFDNNGKNHATPLTRRLYVLAASELCRLLLD
jgi:hypothetical protein